MGISAEAQMLSITRIGADPIHKFALVYQWREFSKSIHPDITKNRSEMTRILGQLNSHIENETFFAGGKELSIADEEIFANLIPFFKQLSFAEKQQYISLSRWFDHIQFLKKDEIPPTTVIPVNALY